MAATASAFPPCHTNQTFDDEKTFLAFILLTGRQDTKSVQVNKTLLKSVNRSTQRKRSVIPSKERNMKAKSGKSNWSLRSKLGLPALIFVLCLFCFLAGFFGSSLLSQVDPCACASSFRSLLDFVSSMLIV